MTTLNLILSSPPMAFNLKFGCRNNGDAPILTTFQQLLGSWRIMGQTNPDGGDFYKYNPETCEDLVYQFKTNAVLDLIIGYDNPDGANCLYDLFLTGNWHVEGRIITVLFAEENSTFDILKLTGVTLEIRDNGDCDIISLEKIKTL